MLKISKPTTRKQLRSFIGMINYYRDMWRKRSEVLAPLTELTSTTMLWKWKEKHNKAFHTIKKSSAERRSLRTLTSHVRLKFTQTQATINSEQ